MMQLLQEEAELNEIVQLVGMDALSAQDRLKLEAARSIREDFLHQNAFHEVDTYSSLQKQYFLMRLLLDFYHQAQQALAQGVLIDRLTALEVREGIGRFKYVPEKETQAAFDRLEAEMTAQMQQERERKESL